MLDSFFVLFFLNLFLCSVRFWIQNSSKWIGYTNTWRKRKKNPLNGLNRCCKQKKKIDGSLFDSFSSIFFFRSFTSFIFSLSLTSSFFSLFCCLKDSSFSSIFASTKQTFRFACSIYKPCICVCELLFCHFNSFFFNLSSPTSFVFPSFFSFHFHGSLC